MTPENLPAVPDGPAPGAPPPFDDDDIPSTEWASRKGKGLFFLSWIDYDGPEPTVGGTRITASGNPISSSGMTLSALREHYIPVIEEAQAGAPHLRGAGS